MERYNEQAEFLLETTQRQNYIIYNYYIITNYQHHSSHMIFCHASV